MDSSGNPWVSKAQEYRDRPDPEAFDLKTLGMIWLHTSCLYEVFNADPIIPDTTWDLLTVHLRKNHQFLDAPLRWAIPWDALVSSTASAVPWDDPVGLQAVVRKSCAVLLGAPRPKVPEPVVLPSPPPEEDFLARF